MKKITTLYLERKVHISKSNPDYAHKSTNDLNIKTQSPADKALKPFLHKDQSSGISLYLTKKSKIIFDDH